jgi:hypothetical protein
VRTVSHLGGAPPHFSHYVRAFLDRTFPDSWIGKGGPTAWPLHSLVLTPLVLLLCGFVNKITNHETVQNVNELHDRIITAAECSTKEMLASTRQKSEYHLDVYHTTNGAHTDIY